MKKTHLFNPKWTPHAKFHDAITISLATLLGGSSLYFLQQKDHDDKNLLFATLLPSFFWSSVVASYAFPGAEDLGAEFPEKIKKVGRIKLNEGGSECFYTFLACYRLFSCEKEKIIPEEFKHKTERLLTCISNIFSKCQVTFIAAKLLIV